MKKVIREQVAEIAKKFVEEKCGCECNVWNVDDMHTYAYVECPLHNHLGRLGFSERAIVRIDLKTMKVTGYAKFVPVEQEWYEN